MRATEVLTAHHDELRSLMRELAQTPAGSTDGRRRLVNRLMAELSMHEQIEDEIFYPATTVLSALIPIAHAEHRQLEDQLAVVLRTGPRGDRFDEELAALIAAVEHHAGKEESEMFPEVVAKLGETELGELGEQLAARLQQLRGSRLTQLRLRAKRELIRRL